MQTTSGQLQERVPVLRTPEPIAPAIQPKTYKEIPYDYVAEFPLLGKCGNRIQQVINISTEGAFVAVEIAYSFIPAKLPPLSASVGALSLMKSFTNLISTTKEQETDATRLLQQSLLVRFCGIDFFYSIVDSSSGREMQNLKVHSRSGLGESTGQRPFRSLPKPMLYMPRSTIRIEVEEISEGILYGYDDEKTKLRIGATLFIVLHGYKILGYGAG